MGSFRASVLMCSLFAGCATKLFVGVRVGPDGRWSVHDTEASKDIKSHFVGYPAFGTYDNSTLSTTGWANLEIHTNASFADDEAAYAAGFLEGSLTFFEIYEFVINAHGGKSPFSPALATWVGSNLEYVRSNVASNQDNAFWYHTGLTMRQFDGLYDGYTARAPVSMQFSKEVLYAITLIGDLDDLCPAFGCSSSHMGHHKCTSKDECDADATPVTFVKERTHGNGHCSILVKPVGPNGIGAPSDVMFGHTTWNPLPTMGPRIMKNYDFAFGHSAANSSVVPGRTIVFSSYPAVLYSFDDWYTISSGLTVSETTIINNNPALWAQVLPTSVVIWSRAMVANRLAATGQQWVNVLSQQNSGTYNNAWHIVDWKTWTPNAPIPDGFLWHVEQMPGVFAPIDLSPVLRTQTYWASYNRVFNEKMFNLTGQWDLVKEYGAHFTWSGTSRANIFRRDESTVTDMATYQTMMRYNNFKSDPLSTQGCTGGAHSASDAISERGDLSPTTGCSAAQGTAQLNEGGIDCKVTSWTTLSTGKLPYLRMLAQAGLTNTQQPTFMWSTSPFAAYAHLGQPDAWDFPWVDYDSQWE